MGNAEFDGVCSVTVTAIELPITCALPPSTESNRVVFLVNVNQRKAIEIILNSDKIPRQTRQETENFTSLREGKTLFKLISEPDQAKIKGIIELKF